MLSSVLNSDKAIMVNIKIMRAFVRIKELILTNTELRLLIEKLNRRVNGQDINIKKNKKEIQILATLIKQLLEPPPLKPKIKIGFLVD